MSNKKVATNIPKALLDEATQMTGLNQTQVLIAGLKEIIAREKRQMLLQMKGKIHIRPPQRHPGRSTKS